MTNIMENQLENCTLDTVLPPPTTDKAFLRFLAERLAYKFSEGFEQQSEMMELTFEELEDRDEPINVDFTVSTWRAIVQNLRRMSA